MNGRFRLFTGLVTVLLYGSICVLSSLPTAAQQANSLINNTYTTTAVTTSTTRIMVGGAVLTVELAETATAQENGLSGRLSLPSDHGMLFVFKHQDYWSFWMVDMRFPLDIIWFNSTRQVVFTEPNLSPCTPQNCPVITSAAKAMYVLEANAGFIAAHKIRFGTTFVFLDR